MTVRFFAAARAAAGTPETTLAAADLDTLRAGLAEKFGGELARVLSVSSFLVDGVVARGGPLAEGTVVDVLPPFAGG
ncbi:molybdopterin converting factor small subunit [Phytomonospora endophytica]|uniref:Molybdopterin converting factor small subunit n=1 Tax=Phytomonospora endophytica TaxID=714109 RepID=A0A841FYX7_9ACTN|nr:molybdopterin converting factor small subunit [Phytomonospora endophytica]